MAVPSRACSGLAYIGEPADRMSVLVVGIGEHRDAEVDEVAVAGLVEQHVRRFHVAVHDAERVRGGERGADLFDEACHLGNRYRAFGDPFRQRPAAQQPEHQERATGTAPVVVQRHDVRMLEPGHELGFGLEPLHEPWVIRELGAHDLDRDLAAHARLHRPVHRTERALADDLTELVARHRDTEAAVRATGRRA